MMKNRINERLLHRISLALLSALICAATFIYYKDYIIYVIVSIFFLWLIGQVISLHTKEKWLNIASSILIDLKIQLSTYIDTMNMPMAITNKQGTIKWNNPAFVKLVQKNAYGFNITSIIKDIDKPIKDRIIEIAGTKFIKESFDHQYQNNKYTLYRLIDEQNDIKASTLYQQYLSVVAIIQVDNYFDLSSMKESISKAEITHNIEEILNVFAEPMNGMLKKTNADSYILVFERKHLAGLIQSKFEVLDKISVIDVDGAKPTISIAIGAGDSLQESYVSAKMAMELAIGRGGNQAVIKRKDKYSFYGGPKGSIVRSSKVKSRMLSKTLKTLMQQSDKVFIMGHKVPDFDSLGSAMGIACCSRFLNQKTYIVIEPPTASLDEFIQEVSQTEEYYDVFITPIEAVSLLTDSSLVVVLDTQVENLTACEDLIKLSKNIVVIDHHLRGENTIKDAILYYHEPFASSTSELVAEIIQYFSDSITLLKIEAEALLAGITVDTKNFTFKTGVRTFQAASFLRKFGADTTIIKKHFKDDYETFVAKAKVVENREILHKNIAISVCEKGIANSKIVAAQAADILVSIRGINTSYVCSYQSDRISISGRSIEGQNVQLVLERLGGGGYSTIAAAELKGVDMDEAKTLLIKSIEEEFI